MTKQQIVGRLRQVGYRMTAQRSAVLDAIWECEEHFTVEEIRAALPGTERSVDTSTIYRTLELLCELKVLHALTASSPTEYERLREPHHHLVCRECGKVTALPNYHLDELMRHLMEEHEFSADLTHLAIPGNCLHCAGTTPPGE